MGASDTALRLLARNLCVTQGISYVAWYALWAATRVAGVISSETPSCARARRFSGELNPPEKSLDSQRMVIHIQGGKGRKDRDVVPSVPI